MSLFTRKFCAMWGWWCSMFVSAWLTSNVCQDNGDQRGPGLGWHTLTANIMGRWGKQKRKYLQTETQSGPGIPLQQPVLPDAENKRQSWVMWNFVVLQLHCISVILHFPRLYLTLKSFLWPERRDGGRAWRCFSIQWLHFNGVLTKR